VREWALTPKASEESAGAPQLNQDFLGGDA
jgi:hypothetical protein